MASFPGVSSGGGDLDLSSGVDGDDKQSFFTDTGVFNVGGGVKSKDLMLAVVALAAVFLFAKRGKK